MSHLDWLTRDYNAVLVILVGIILGLALCMRGPKRGYKSADKDDDRER